MEDEQLILNEIINLFELNKFSEAYKRLNTTKFKKIEKYFLYNLEGLILAQLRKIDLAIVCFENSIKINPSFVEAYYNAGTILIAENRCDEAERFLKSAISINDKYFDAYFNLSLVCKKLDKLDEGLIYLYKCLEISKDNFEVYNNIGLILFIKKNFIDSVYNFKKCIQLNPEYVEAYNNLGLVYLKLDNIEEAVLNFNKVLKYKIDHKQAIFNLGCAYEKLRKFDQAEFFYEKVLKLDKNFIRAYVHLARVLFEKCKYDECSLLIEKSFTISKEQECYEILGDCEMLRNNFVEALENYNKSLSINSNQPELLIKIIFNYNYINHDQKDYFKVIDKYKKLLINFRSELKNKNILDQPFKNHVKEIKNEIKVGFITSDLREHPVGYQILPILGELRKFKKIKIFAFYNNNIEDEYTKKIKNIFNFWENIYSKSDLEVVSLIRSFDIDILVDLNGYTKGHRIGVLLKRAAPIQVTWAGYLASIGISEIDYIIADNFVIPDGKESLYREKIIKLSIWSGLNPENKISLNKVIPFTKNKFITFGSFNNPRKISLSVINLWSKILIALPDSKLVIRSMEFKNIWLREYYSNLFDKNSVKKNQLIFEDQVSREDLLEMYNEIDVALDPFPYTGGTTSFEATWMCVPILTKIGDTFISRCGGSINNTLGLKDWICENDEDYFNKAVKFSNDPIYLQSVKDFLIEERKKSIIFDGKKQAKEIYQSFSKLLGI